MQSLVLDLEFEFSDCHVALDKRICFLLSIFLNCFEKSKCETIRIGPGAKMGEEDVGNTHTLRNRKQP